MNDRELLELAAKAVGYGEVWYLESSDTPYVGKQYEIGKTIEYSVFNPLTDDGDALRLAVILEIDLSFYTDRDKVYAQTKHLLGLEKDGTASYQAHEYHKEFYEGDPYAATRRAIVRAAAEIGMAQGERND